jgi:hypothetical protein
VKRSGPRKLPNAPVLWEEVWTWCDDITSRFGYDAKVVIFPPLPVKHPVRFSVMVELRKIKVSDPQKDTTITKWRGVVDSTLTAEQVALTMVVEIHRQLDSEELERERAALTAGLLL